MKFEYITDAIRHAYNCCKKEMKENGELFYDVFLTFDTDYSGRFYVFHELDDGKIVSWIEDRYYDYVVETNKIGHELEQLRIWQYILEEDVLRYPVLYKDVRKAFKIAGKWVYRYPRKCTPEAQINFSLDN